MGKNEFHLVWCVKTERESEQKKKKNTAESNKAENCFLAVVVILNTKVASTLPLHSQ